MSLPQVPESACQADFLGTLPEYDGLECVLCRTALILAIEQGCDESLPLLIAAGADINHTVAEEDTPLHLAIRYSRNAAAILFIQRKNIAINAKVSSSAGQNTRDALHSLMPTTESGSSENLSWRDANR